jgi:hypothetical protein
LLKRLRIFWNLFSRNALRSSGVIVRACSLPILSITGDSGGSGGVGIAGCADGFGGFGASGAAGAERSFSRDEPSVVAGAVASGEAGWVAVGCGGSCGEGAESAPCGSARVKAVAEASSRMDFFSIIKRLLSVSEGAVAAFRQVSERETG